jgi:gluconolactonase
MQSANVGIAIFDPSFQKLLGPCPQISLCLEELNIPLFHEAGVFIEETGELFVTSNQYEDQDGMKVISILKVKITNESYSHEIIFPDISMANGGVNYKDGILFCDQGGLSRPGGLVYMSIRPPYPSSTILSGFMGVPFNSVNDVVTAEDGAIWFTDPIYGYEQGIRPAPKLPSQVYRYLPSSKSIRAMADGFGRPNGIAFSPDERIIYITVS